MSVTLVGSAFAAALFPSKRWFYVLGLLAAVALAILDQVRWQPWFYQYCLTMLVLATAERREGRTEPATLNPVRWVVVATYLWSGLHKCNGGFLHFYQHGIVNRIREGADGLLASAIDAAAYLAGPFELLIGVLLIVPATRRAGAFGATFLHLVILVFLGPLFGGNNSVIWPWNAAMIALVLTLFWSDRNPLFKLPAAKAPGSRAVAWVVAVLVFLMPALSVVQAWPQYLSFHLYSGQGQRLQLVLFPAGQAELPDTYREVLIASPVSDQLRVIDLVDWSFRDLNVPVAGDADLLLLLGQELDRRLGLEDNAGFFYHDFPNYIEQRGWSQFRPSEFRNLAALPALEPPQK